MRSVLIAGTAAYFVLSGAIAQAAPAASPRADALLLHDLARNWTRPVVSLPLHSGSQAPAASRADALSVLAGGRQWTDRCASPLMIALSQNGSRLNQPTRLLLDRAAGARPEAASKWLLTQDGVFLIHYSTDPRSPDRVDPRDDDLDGSPDGVERLSRELTDVFADFVHVLKWLPAPAPSLSRTVQPEHPVDVFLAGLRGGSGEPDGFTLPVLSVSPPTGGDPDSQPEGADSAIYLDASLASQGAASRHVVAHQIAHVIQNRESVRESAWWHEASASWLEDRLVHTAPDIARSLRASSLRRTRGLDDGTLTMSVEGFLWPHYLARTGGDSETIRRLWQEMAAVPGNNTFDAIDRVLRRELDSSLADEIRVFNIWNLFLGRADDGQHYPFGSHLPTPQGDGTYESFPARGSSLTGPVSPLGSAMIRVLGDGTRGGLRIRFSGDDAGAWDVLLIVYAAGPLGTVRSVPLEMDGSGHGYIALPWKDLAAIDILIQNLAAPGTQPANYSFAIDYDPAIPFDLLGFTTAESADGALLTWLTESEERLAGWNIYRSAAPLGPFTRINQYLLPGAGDAGRPMSYIFLDSSALPRHKYYYYLEGTTLDGFTDASHASGVRLGGSARDPAPEE